MFSAKKMWATPRVAPATPSVRRKGRWTIGFLPRRTRRGPTSSVAHKKRTAALASEVEMSQVRFAAFRPGLSTKVSGVVPRRE